MRSFKILSLALIFQLLSPLGSPSSFAMVSDRTREELRTHCEETTNRSNKNYNPSQDEASFNYDEELALEEEYLEKGRRQAYWHDMRASLGRAAYFGSLGVLVVGAFYLAPQLIAATGNLALLQLVSGGGQEPAARVGRGRGANHQDTRSWKHAFLGVAGLFVSPYMISGLFQADKYKRFSTWLGGSKNDSKEMRARVLGVKAKVESVKGILEEHKRKALDILEGLESSLNDDVIEMKIAGLQDKGKRERFFNDLKKVLLIANIPSDIKKIEYNEGLESQLNELLALQTPEVKKVFRQLTQSIAVSSQGSHVDSNKLFLLGAPGTGKTYIMQRYADLLGLPLIKISLSEAQGAKDLIGDDYNPEGKLAIVARSFMKTPAGRNFKNGILFFDEADKVPPKTSYAGVTEFLNNLLNGQKSIRLNDLGISVDVSRFVFVFAGNKPFQESSLMSRLKTVNFDGFNLRERVGLACDSYGTQAAKRNLTLKEADFEELVNIALVDQDENVGLRPLLQTINDWAQAKLTADRMSTTLDFDIAEQHKKNSRNVWDPLTAITLTKRKYEVIKDDLNDAIRKKLEEKIFPQADMMVHLGDKDYEVLKGLLRTVEHILELPHKVKYLGEDQRIQEITTKIELSLAEYPEDVKNTVYDVLDSHVANSFPDTSSSKQVLYFYGPPATGKTYLAEHLAEALGVSLIRVSLTGGSKSQTSANGAVAFDSASGLSDFTKSFLAGLSQAYDKNAVVFIDEADKVLNSDNPEVAHLKTFLHGLLDPGAETIRLDDLNIDLDISHFLFVLGANERIQKKDGNGKLVPNDSLESRMSMVAFKDFAPERKVVIAEKNFDFLVAEHLPDCVGACASDLQKEKEKIPGFVKEGSDLRQIIKKVDTLVKTFKIRMIRNKGQ
ncbi:MAG: AAA family ATPase [Deltaproteobacteria bacterium]|nr:AAA family ATPase [Deltaproteobacteria bacterium]